MPCHDALDDSYDAYERSEQIHELTRMLCALCGFSQESDIQAVPGLAKWWEAHQKADKLRLQREAQEREQARLKKVALEKLTAIERKALGL